MSGFQLSTQSAQRIVAEIGGIVGQNINMMDAQGYIIASTDPARIGFLPAVFVVFNSLSRARLLKNGCRNYISARRRRPPQRAPGLTCRLRTAAILSASSGLPASTDR